MTEELRQLLRDVKAFHDRDSGCNGFTADYEHLRLRIDETLAAAAAAGPVAWINHEHIAAYKARATDGIAWASPVHTEFYDVPLYAAPPAADRMREALEWYAERLRHVRKNHSEGDKARAELSADCGARADAALAAAPAPAEGGPDEQRLAADILAELGRARAMFPGRNVTFAALVEEVGELATATFEESRESVRKEAIQVAVMAMRIVLDGDHTFDGWRASKGLDPLVSDPSP